MFSSPATESLYQNFDHKTVLQRQFLSRLHDALTHEVPSTFVEKPFKGVQNLKQFRAGDLMRGYCIYADEPPGYNVFYIFQITDHRYGQNPLRQYDEKAGKVLEELRSLENVAETERYLEQHDANDAKTIRQILDQL